MGAEKDDWLSDFLETGDSIVVTISDDNENSECFSHTGFEKTN